jgi:hypothetical protein
MFGGCCLFRGGRRGPLFQVPALLGGAEPPRGRVGKPLGGKRQVPIELAELNPDGCQAVRHLGALGFRGGARTSGLIAMEIGFSEPLPGRRKLIGQLLEPRLHAGGFLRQPVHLAPRQRQLNGELLL